MGLLLAAVTYLPYDIQKRWLRVVELTESYYAGKLQGQLPHKNTTRVLTSALYAAT